LIPDLAACTAQPGNATRTLNPFTSSARLNLSIAVPFIVALAKNCHLPFSGCALNLDDRSWQIAKRPCQRSVSRIVVK